MTCADLADLFVWFRIDRLRSGLREIEIMAEQGVVLGHTQITIYHAMLEALGRIECQS